MSVFFLLRLTLSLSTSMDLRAKVIGEWQELKLNSRVHCEKNDIIQNSLVGNGIINHTSGLVETVQPKAQVRGMLHRDRFLNFNIIASLKCTFGAFSERINEKMNRNLR